MNEFFRLADDLTMFASSIREAANNQGKLPHPWRIDDWLTMYRIRFEAQAKSHKRKAERG